MLLYFDINGVLKEQLSYGPNARAGTTEFTIYAYFEGYDLTIYDAASLKLRKPDLEETEYPSLLMERDTLTYHSSIQPSEYFQDGQTYPVYKFDFNDFNVTNDVAILLDTPGLWKAIIFLYGSNRSIAVQGLATFIVENGVFSPDGTTVDIGLVLPTVYAELATKLSAIDSVLTVNNIATQDFTDIANGQVLFDRATDSFYKFNGHQCELVIGDNVTIREFESSATFYYIMQETEQKPFILQYPVSGSTTDYDYFLSRVSQIGTTLYCEFEEIGHEYNKRYVYVGDTNQGASYNTLSSVIGNSYFEHNYMLEENLGDILTFETLATGLTIKELFDTYNSKPFILRTIPARNSYLATLQRTSVIPPAVETDAKYYFEFIRLGANSVNGENDSVNSFGYAYRGMVDYNTADSLTLSTIFSGTTYRDDDNNVVVLTDTYPATKTFDDLYALLGNSEGKVFHYSSHVETYSMGIINKNYNSNNTDYTYSISFMQIGYGSRLYYSVEKDELVGNYFAANSGKWNVPLFANDVSVYSLPTTATSLSDDKIAKLRNDNARIFYTDQYDITKYFYKVGPNYFEYISIEQYTGDSFLTLRRERIYVDFTNKTYQCYTVTGNTDTSAYIYTYSASNFPSLANSTPLDITLTSNEYNNLFGSSEESLINIYESGYSRNYVFRRTGKSVSPRIAYTYICIKDDKLWTIQDSTSDNTYKMTITCKGYLTFDWFQNNFTDSTTVDTVYSTVGDKPFVYKRSMTGGYQNYIVSIVSTQSYGYAFEIEQIGYLPPYTDSKARYSGTVPSGTTLGDILTGTTYRIDFLVNVASADGYTRRINGSDYSQSSTLTNMYNSIRSTEALPVLYRYSTSGFHKNLYILSFGKNGSNEAYSFKFQDIDTGEVWQTSSPTTYISGSTTIHSILTGTTYFAGNITGRYTFNYSVSDNNYTLAHLHNLIGDESCLVYISNQGASFVGGWFFAYDVPVANLYSFYLVSVSDASKKYSGTISGDTDIKTILNGSTNSNLELTDNKVTSLSSASTDTQYPSAKAVYDKITGSLTPSSIGSVTTTTITAGTGNFAGAQFTVGSSNYNGLYIFTYGNCMILIPLYNPVTGTEYKISAALLNTSSSYDQYVLTYRFTGSMLQIYQKQNVIPTGYTAYLFKVALY